MAADKELTEFINRALGLGLNPKPRSPRQSKRIIQYRWNLKEGGLTKFGITTTAEYD